MLAAENLIKLLNRISEQSTQHHYTYYIDSLNRLLSEDPNYCSKDESNLIKKLLSWEINTDSNHPYPLTPIFIPRYEEHSFETLLDRCFNGNEITLLSTLSDDKTFNSEILARINDILWCLKHKDQKTNKKPINFVENAIKHYCISAQQQQDRDFSITRLIRAINLITLIKDPFSDELIQSVREKLDDNDFSDGTLKLFQVLYPLTPELKEELLKINQALLDNNYPIPKMNSECLNAYYDIYIQYIDDLLQKNLYREKKIESLLWFAQYEEKKGNHPKALNHAIQAEKELNNSKITQEKRRYLGAKIMNCKEKNNKLPQGMRWHSYPINIPINDIKNSLKKSENLPFTDIIKRILIDFKGIDYKTIKDSSGVFYLTSNLLTSDESGLLTHDEKPKLINYSDSELIKIYAMSKIMRNEISIKISILLDMIRNRTIENNFSILEKHLVGLGVQERKEIILNAIKYAIQGDLCTALHLIIPQLEHFFRKKIQLSGIDTSIFTRENNFEELSITQIFQNDKTEKVLIDEYGHDIFCELYLILLDKRCGNYRNKVCHGRMSFTDFCSEESLYAWGLCLYAIFKDLLLIQAQQAEVCKGEIYGEK
jgi:hypothetical protein